MSSQIGVPPSHEEQSAGTTSRGRRLGNWSVAALLGFIPWTVAFIIASAALADSQGLDPDQPFGTKIEGVEWLQWAAALAVWVLPLAAAAVLGFLGLRRGGGTTAKIGAYVGGALAALLLVQTGAQALAGLVTTLTLP